MTWVSDEEKLADAPRRCVRALELIEVFRATDESELIEKVYGPFHIFYHRYYPAGYVEELIENIRVALAGEEPDAEAHED